MLNEKKSVFHVVVIHQFLVVVIWKEREQQWTKLNTEVLDIIVIWLSLYGQV